MGAGPFTTIGSGCHGYSGDLRPAVSVCRLHGIKFSEQPPDLELPARDGAFPVFLPDSFQTLFKLNPLIVRLGTFRCHSSRIVVSCRYR